MSQVQLVGVALGLVFALIGLQLFSRWMHRAPLDVQTPQRLIETRPAPPELPPPPSLSRTTQLVDDGLTSPAAAERFLVPLLARIEASRPGDPRRLPPVGHDPRRWLDEVLDLLEEE